MAETATDDEVYYVLLETGAEERFVTEAQLRTLLASYLHAQADDVEAAVTHLLNTACELTLQPGHYCQWYVTRLDRPSSRRRDW